MPKETFRNLPQEKKEWMDDILLNRFYQQPISQIKVAQIVDDMAMSRGSFYKYFEDLEDAHLYIIQKYATVFHVDIQRFIKRYKSDFFFGIQQYLVWCVHQDKESSYWKAIYLLTRTSSQYAFKRMPFSKSTKMIEHWQAILDLNQFNITSAKESISFLYFTMELTITSLSDYIINNWSPEELIKDFQYKTKWLSYGLKN
ncbi:TetR/AcrR family transcriptional regulator [Vagococcus vulneris]|uniref:TetR family transcriptional regulator n=1 Tax=Vagococcus vulneris TaxID=1977869 RepID=A0A430A1N2_9ENTE|nr:TetR/AcrR family transcriptional regulator [Vagococcus vulneris]RSU00282.1 TetR family transcriptional regulator [Vagococcus vulneris]